MSQRFLPLLFATSSPLTAVAEPDVLWHEKPVTSWNTEALPIGKSGCGTMENLCRIFQSHHCMMLHAWRMNNPEVRA